SSTMHPDILAEYQALKIIGFMWSNLIQAFINPDLSLTEQLEKLSVYTHTSFVLYCQHGSSLISPQLYYDSQSLVKASYFYVIHQTALDPDQDVELHHVGSDRGEHKFCSVWTATHDTNPDALALADSLLEDSDMDRIIEQNPDLNKQHRRTVWLRKPDVDHVNQNFFKGDLRAGNVRHEYAYNSGR
ncbi:hypothetical protein BT96DRAFT_771543, partial [Gymnopus androsaceus JB14]